MGLTPGQNKIGMEEGRELLSESNLCREGLLQRRACFQSRKAASSQEPVGKQLEGQELSPRLQPVSHTGQAPPEARRLRIPVMQSTWASKARKVRGEWGRQTHNQYEQHLCLPVTYVGWMRRPIIKKPQL